MGDIMEPSYRTLHEGLRGTTRRVVAALGRCGHWSLVAVGVGFTFLSELVFFLRGAQHPIIQFLELLLPIVVGVGLIWYGFQFERDEYSSRQIGVMSFAVLLGMGLFVILASYMRFLLALEGSFPEQSHYLLLNAMAIGAVINFIYAYQFIKIQKSRRKLESRTNRLVKIASMVSHDLRNPLNVAMGRVQLIEASETDVDGLASLNRALQRIESLTEELLVFAKGEHTVDVMEPISLEAKAQEAWDVIDSNDVRLDVNATGNVTANPDKLHHLFENVFQNAIYHGETTSTIEIDDLEKETGFYVADDGEGIPPETRKNVLSQGFTTSDAGNGLGLFIVDEIATAHDWEIRIKESENGGARFEFVCNPCPNED